MTQSSTGSPDFISPALAEQSQPLAENDIIAHFDRLTPEMIETAATAAREQAHARLLSVAAEDGRSSAEVEPPVLKTLREVNTILGLESGSVDIVDDLVRATHPDKTVRDVAADQWKKTQDFSDRIFLEPTAEFKGYPQLHEALAAIDITTLDPRAKQQYDYYIPLLPKSRQDPSAESAGNVYRLRQDLTGAEAAFQKNIRDGGSDNNAAQDQLIQNMADLRLTIAEAEGKETWTAKQVEGLTLGTVDAVTDFYEGVKPGIVERYQKSIGKLQALLDADMTDRNQPLRQLQEADIPLYAQKLIEQSYDSAKITFSFEKTMNGLWNMYERLFNVDVNESPDAPVWAPEVRSYIVYDKDDMGNTDKVLGSIFVDPFIRDGKRGSAATYTLKYGQVEPGPDGEDQTTQLPLAAVITNFKSKMTMRNVEYLSHEVGHAWQDTFARTRGPEFGGDKVPFDIREIISQATE